VSRFGMRIAPPLFVAGIGAGSFRRLSWPFTAHRAPLWGVSRTGRGVSLLPSVSRQVAGSAIYLARSPFSACGPA
jgi:hypothetical protein